MQTMKLRPYQEDCLKFCRTTRTPALFLKMRLGKTLITIRRIKELSYKIKRVLVVAPTDALGSWEQELNKERETDYIYLLGCRQHRLEALTLNRKWNLINKEGFLAIGPELVDTKWDCIILDESTFIKNHKSKVSKFYTKNFKRVQYKFILSGTPRPESDLDLFQQFLFLDNGKTFQCDNYWLFRESLFTQLGYDWFPIQGARDWINKQISKSAFILDRKDVELDQPKVYEKRYIDIPKNLKAVYNEIEEDLIIDYKETQKSTRYKIVQYTWLRQFTGGFIDRNLVWDGKLKALQNLLQGELKGENIVIWCVYNQEVRELFNIIHKINPRVQYITGQDRPDARKEIFKFFQDKKFEVLIVQCECSKFGVDLSAADTVIYYSSPLGLLTRQQTEDRVVKVGDKHPILYIDLIVKDSIDEDINHLMNVKKIKSATMLDVIKRLQDRRLNLNIF